MAMMIFKAWEALPKEAEGNRLGKVVALCGAGHTDFGFGVPERLEKIFAAKGIKIPRVLRLTVRADIREASDGKEERNKVEEAGADAGAATRAWTFAEEAQARRPADWVLLFTPDPEEGEEVD
jgi:hypothetical protein